METTISLWPTWLALLLRKSSPATLPAMPLMMEGYTKLGFSGGGGGTNPACCRYGYGFVQGANAAAAEKDDPGGDELFLGVRLQLLCLS